MMKNDKNSNFYKQDLNLNMNMETLNDPDNTNMILNRDHTRYTDGANKIIKKVQNAFLEERRAEEIDLALANKDKERFMELTSENWKEAL